MIGQMKGELSGEASGFDSGRLKLEVRGIGALHSLDITLEL